MLCVSLLLFCILLQVAKTLAPSVIYIDEVEKVFVSDKKKAKEFGGQVRPVTACQHPVGHLVAGAHVVAGLRCCFP
jgi:hypothetical protein